MGYVWLTACVWGRGFISYLSVFFSFGGKGGKNGIYAVLFSLQIGFLVYVIVTAGWFDCTRCTCFCPNFVLSFSVLVAKYL